MALCLRLRRQLAKVVKTRELHRKARAKVPAAEKSVLQRSEAIGMEPRDGAPLGAFVLLRRALHASLVCRL